MKEEKVRSSLFSRRSFMQMTAVAGAAGVCWRYGIDKLAPNFHVVRRSQPMMGTTLNLTICGPDRDAAESAVNSTISKMLNLEKKLSRHNPESELSQLNKTGFLDQASLDLRQVLNLARSISEKTQGAFDVTTLPLLKLHNRYTDQAFVPDASAVADALALVDYKKVLINAQQISLPLPGMEITLDGIGKGYIVDQGVAALNNTGFPNVLVEAGGDLMTSGFKTQGKPWRIGIQNPRPYFEQKLISIATTNQAVATSGDYMQPYSQDLLHHHIVNPFTGYSPPVLASCTITAPNTALADGLATGAMVLGPEKSIELLKNIPDCEGYFITKDLKPYKSQGFSIIT